MRHGRATAFALAAAVAVSAVAVGTTVLVRTTAPLASNDARAGHHQLADATATRTVTTRPGEVVPWALRLADPRAGSPPVAPPSDAPRCEADDVRLSAGPAARRPPYSVGVTLTLTNDGRDCSLPAWADGTGALQDGTPIPVGNAGRSRIALREPPTLRRGATATTTAFWSSWCGGKNPGRWNVAVSVGTGTVRATVPGDPPPAPPCHDEGAFGLGAWTVHNANGQPAVDPQQALVGTLEAPASGRIGAVLPMVLHLRNPSQGPVPLTPCPAYGFSLSETGVGSFHSASPPLLLNCPEAPAAIPAGGQVDFALQLTLSTALVDGRLRPGRFYVSAGFGGDDAAIRPIDVLPAAPRKADPCTYTPVLNADPRVAGLPDPTAQQPGSAVLHTNRGDLEVALATGSSPCGVAAFAHLVRGGFWDAQRCYALSGGRFPVLDCGVSDGSARRAGITFPTEATGGTQYPAGTVVLSHSGPYTDAGSLRVIYGDVPYPPEFTVLGRITSGLNVVRDVARAGTVDGGEYSAFTLPLSITGVALR